MHIVSLIRRALFAALLLFGISAPLRAEVFLHAFNWRYAEVADYAELIAKSGFDAVLVAPAYRSEGSAWWARYQPQDYRLIEHPLGDSEDFAGMVQALREVGVDTHADVVFNHMANESAQRADLDYPGARLLARYASEPQRTQALRLFGDTARNLFSAADFGEPRCITDYNDVLQVQNFRLCGGGSDRGLPDLRPTPEVIAAQQDYLRALRGLGVRGFRIDAAKHMSLDHLRQVFAAEVVGDARLYGEIITGGGSDHPEFQRFLRPYLEATDHAAYDFPLFHQLRLALGFGGSMTRLIDPQAAGQALPGARAITFALTHDIPNNAGFRGLLLDPVDETLAYAYLLGRGVGSVLVYSDHDESGDRRWRRAWRRLDLRRMIGFSRAVQGQPWQLLKASDCQLWWRRGDAAVVAINKCAEPAAETLDLAASGLRGGGTYLDALHGAATASARSSSVAFRLLPRQAAMWQLRPDPAGRR